MQYFQITKNDGKLQLVSKSATAEACSYFESDVLDYLEHIAIFTHSSESWRLALMKGSVLAPTALCQQMDMVWYKLWEFACSYLCACAKLTWAFMSKSVKDLGAAFHSKNGIQWQYPF